jgi:hypothetical protein
MHEDTKPATQIRERRQWDDTDTIEGERNGRIRRMTRSTPGGWDGRRHSARYTARRIQQRAASEPVRHRRTGISPDWSHVAMQPHNRARSIRVNSVLSRNPSLDENRTRASERRASGESERARDMRSLQRGSGRAGAEDCAARCCPASRRAECETLETEAALTGKRATDRNARADRERRRRVVGAANLPQAWPSPPHTRSRRKVVTRTQALFSSERYYDTYA